MKSDNGNIETIGISIDLPGTRNREITVPFNALCKPKNVVVLVGIELIDGRNGGEREKVNELERGNL